MTDLVDIARKRFQTGYVYGPYPNFNGTKVITTGRGATGIGIDCSNLVSQTLHAAGYDVAQLPTFEKLDPKTGKTSAGILDAQGNLTPQGSRYYAKIDSQQTGPGAGDLVMFRDDKGQGHIGIVKDYKPESKTGTFYGSQSTKGPSEAEFTTEPGKLGYFFGGTTRRDGNTNFVTFLRVIAPRDPEAAAQSLAKIDPERATAAQQLGIDLSDALPQDASESPPEQRSTVAPGAGRFGPFNAVPFPGQMPGNVGKTRPPDWVNDYNKLFDQLRNPRRSDLEQPRGEADSWNAADMSPSLNGSGPDFLADPTPFAGGNTERADAPFLSPTSASMSPLGRLAQRLSMGSPTEPVASDSIASFGSLAPLVPVASDPLLSARAFAPTDDPWLFGSLAPPVPSTRVASFGRPASALGPYQVFGLLAPLRLPLA